MDGLPPSGNARDFYRSAPFHHGLVIVDTLQDALDQLYIARDFYTPGMFCGSLRQLQAIPKDTRQLPYSVCLRAHGTGDHGWTRDRDGQQAGQSKEGWEMVREFQSVLADRDVGRALSLTHPLDWSEFVW